MAGPYEQYVDARAEFVSHSERVARLGRFISQVGASISGNPEEFHFDALPGGGFSFQTLNDPAGAFDASQWLDATRIQQLIADLKQKRRAMMIYYEGIPASKREAVPRPPGLRG